MGGTTSWAATSRSSSSHPATGHWRRWSSATRSASGIARDASRSRCPAASRVSPWTYATFRSGFRSGATGDGPRSQRGVSWRGPATSDDAAAVVPHRSGPMTREAPAAMAVAEHPGLELVMRRELVANPADASFPLQPGDRALVQPDQAVGRGEPLFERLRDARTLVVGGPAGVGDLGAPGERWTRGASRPAGGRDAEAVSEGELLFQSGGRWRIAAGERGGALEAPFAGVVREVRPGVRIVVRSASSAILGRIALAGPSWGRLQIATGPDGELRAPHVDVGAAGSIIVAGARMDAEALTRARAVGIRGVIVAALGMKEQRDFLASERRGRAAVHGLPPFAILVLDGAARRPIASPVMAMFEALSGTMVSIIGSPPAVVVEDAGVRLPAP